MTRKREVYPVPHFLLQGVQWGWCVLTTTLFECRWGTGNNKVISFVLLTEIHHSDSGVKHVDIFQKLMLVKSLLNSF